MPFNDRILREKEAAVERGRARGETGSHPTRSQRLPPGQYLTAKFPVLDLGFRPAIELADFRLKISGEVETPLEWTWQDLLALPKREQVNDFHCVTRWSKYDVRWGGVSFRDVCEHVHPTSSARYVLQSGRDGYSTNVPLDELLAGDAMLAYELDGQPLPLEHGGPVRVIVPLLYGWKGAKFLNGLEFSPDDRPGFWEMRGYHNHGDPWKEERYW